MSRVLNELPEAFVSHTGISRAVSRAVKAGKLRKLASRLYTRNLEDAPETIVRRNLWGIVAGYFPGSLIADRTAFEAAPASDGSLCLVSEQGRTVELPGVVLRPRRGPGRIASDMPFVEGLYLSSRTRAYLENMRPSRARGKRKRRTLGRAEIENRLDQLIRTAGDGAANQLRDDARAIAPELGLEQEAAQLDALIGTLLGTRRSRLDSPVAIARSRGRHYDPDRMELFHRLHQALRNRPPGVRPAPPRNARSRSTLAFFEAYFSNCVEGTEFLVDEAIRIVFEGRIPRHRPADAHDVAGTWRIVSDTREMGRTPADFGELAHLLRERHRTIMAGRPEVLPGEFKAEENRAGLTVFVAPDLVPGTLNEGFALYRSLESPFERAVYMMFLVSEVHPFADGNGRLARIMMNAELVAGAEERIVVPTVFRSNYLAALRALSRTGRPDPLIRVLDYAQRWTLALDWSSLEAAERELERCNAFLDSDEAEAMGKRLRMPG
ncbi:MAG: cell filamentation protein Fic [Gemmatimonadetes bacterium]|nr:cell filamentation protein Fic [Gemmatimonadota bacterium]MXX70424.1 cell filamentation protein Fic [Gemmatimonadota bacterium]MYC91635.1 cell filamentation protein Fic [Gemmatimonadota bacterium]MYG35317.1 cell filamentation protein Fic [Gemmatimonadota bacterium]